MVLSILAGATPWAPEPDQIESDRPDKPISAKAVQARRRLSDNENKAREPKPVQPTDTDHDVELSPELSPMDDEPVLSSHANDSDSPHLLPAQGVEGFESTPFFSQFNSRESASDQVPSSMSNAVLLNKLDHLISLLEVQEGERTNNETEEIILYLFLGVFIIYVIDSFSRVAKYTR